MIPGSVSISADQYYANRDFLADLVERRQLNIYHSGLATPERYAWIWAEDRTEETLLYILLQLR